MELGDFVEAYALRPLLIDFRHMSSQNRSKMGTTFAKMTTTCPQQVCAYVCTLWLSESFLTKSGGAREEAHICGCKKSLVKRSNYDFAQCGRRMMRLGVDDPRGNCAAFPSPN